MRLRETFWQRRALRPNPIVRTASPINPAAISPVAIERRKIPVMDRTFEDADVLAATDRELTDLAVGLRDIPSCAAMVVQIETEIARREKK